MQETDYLSKHNGQCSTSNGKNAGTNVGSSTGELSRVWGGYGSSAYRVSGSSHDGLDLGGSGWVDGSVVDGGDWRGVVDSGGWRGVVNR